MPCVLQRVGDGGRGAAEVVAEHGAQQNARGGEVPGGDGVAISRCALALAGVEAAFRQVWREPDCEVFGAARQLWQGLRGEAEMSEQRGAICRQAASFCAGAPTQWVSCGRVSPFIISDSAPRLEPGSITVS